MRTLAVSAVLLALTITTACGGQDDGPDAPESGGPSSSADQTSDAPSSAAPELPSLALSDACRRWVDESLSDFTAEGFAADARLATELADSSVTETAAAFAPIASLAQDAADTIGSSDYLDVEAAYDAAIPVLDDKCNDAGVSGVRG